VKPAEADHIGSERRLDVPEFIRAPEHQAEAVPLRLVSPLKEMRGTDPAEQAGRIGDPLLNERKGSNMITQARFSGDAALGVASTATLDRVSVTFVLPKGDVALADTHSDRGAQ
jgi:hypothetical protein